jgi:hypothetical protein
LCSGERNAEYQQPDSRARAKRSAAGRQLPEFAAPEFHCGCTQAELAALCRETENQSDHQAGERHRRPVADAFENLGNVHGSSPVIVRFAFSETDLAARYMNY